MTDETAALREALRPFADEAAELPAGLPDDEPYHHCLSPDCRAAEMVHSDFTVGDLRRARAALAIPPAADLRAQIEEVIAWVVAKDFPPHGAVVRAGDVADRLRVILPPPPLVIEPGRKYRTAGGWMAIGLDANTAAVEDGEGDWDIISYDSGGVAEGINRGLDIIAPWEGEDDAQ